MALRGKQTMMDVFMIMKADVIGRQRVPDAFSFWTTEALILDVSAFKCTNKTEVVVGFSCFMGLRLAGLIFQ